MTKVQKKDIELLAPAGNMEALKAALGTGADAVYIGGTLFSARASAKNFTIEEITEAVFLANRCDSKIFVAVNTLIFDDEMREAFDFCRILKSVGVHGVILQDLGLADLVAKHLRDDNFELHMSTQATIYNVSGIRNIKWLLDNRVDRVVLARELSLDQIEKVTSVAKAENIDIEVFVHGALCVCVSGQCQFSRAMGGRSANRGACAQPCRLPYEDESGQKLHFLSPKDLCWIKHLPELIEAGVKSFKIEGRMKSKEYVATVTSIYRKYLDMAIEHINFGKPYIVADSDMERLKQVFNRGGFTEANAAGIENAEKSGMFALENPGHMGLPVGEMVGDSSYNTKIVKLYEEPAMGDVIETRSMGAQTSVCTVTYIKKRKNEEYVIGDFKGELRRGDILYRLNSKQHTALVHDKIKEIPKYKVNMTLYGTCGEKLKLTVRCKISGGHIIELSKFSESILERARNVALSHYRIAEQLKKLGSTIFVADKIKIFIEEGTNMPIKGLNKLRRDLISDLEEAIRAEQLRDEDKIVPEVEPDRDFSTERPVTDRVYSDFTLGMEDEEIEQYINDEKIKTVEINNISWIKEHLDKGMNVVIGPGLNILNKNGIELFISKGAYCVVTGKELDAEPEKLMVVGFPVKEGTYKNNKGKKIQITKEKHGDKYTIKQIDK